MKLISDKDMIRIKLGDNGPLTTIFSQCYHKSLRNIMVAMHCNKEDAEDVLMDSFVNLRDAIVMNNYRNENVGSYLTAVAINKLKNKNKKDYRIEFLEEEALVLRSNHSESESQTSSYKVDHIIASINELKGKCKSLLTRNLIEGVGLNMLVSELDYSSYDVLKTSKSRCMSKLKQLITVHQEKSKS